MVSMAHKNVISLQTFLSTASWASACIDSAFPIRMTNSATTSFDQILVRYAMSLILRPANQNPCDTMRTGLGKLQKTLRPFPGKTDPAVSESLAWE